MIESIETKQSVKRDDWVSGRGDGVFQFMIPAFGSSNLSRKSVALPQFLPDHNRVSFYGYRDQILLETTRHEGTWANTVATAVTRAAGLGYAVEGQSPRKVKDGRAILARSWAGTFTGWIPFVSMHIRSYILCGRAHVEIVRESKGPSSRVVRLAHLNPLRTRLTDNPRFPVEYMDRVGKIHKLPDWGVMSFGDQLDPTEGEMGWVESSGDRAYDQIATMEAAVRYLYEKLTGSRATSIEFIQGITARALRDAISGGDDDQARIGSMLYKGVVAVPIPGDVPVQRVSIPISEIPDSFNARDVFDNATIVYAAATGQDVNDIDPRLGQRNNLGSGAQAVVLDKKTHGKGLISWRNDWAESLNMWIFDTATKFAWSETSLEDDKAKEAIKKDRASRVETYIKSEIITADEGREMLTEDGDIPTEFDVKADANDNPNKTPNAGQTAVESIKKRADERKTAKKEYIGTEAILRRVYDEAVRLGAQYDYDELVNNGALEMIAITNLLATGSLTPEQWEIGMRELVTKYHVSAMYIGAGGVVPPGGGSALVKSLETSQWPFLANFRKEIENSEVFQPKWRARAVLYAKSAKSAEAEGDVWKQAGRFLPLPAMPAQGTQCHTNCGCKWEIKKIEGDGNYDAYWRREKDDSCQTCLQRESDWSPVQIRGGYLR